MASSGWRRQQTGIPRVLVELRACAHGFAGIPQETRLVYAALANMTGLEVGGLLNTFADLPWADHRQPLNGATPPDMKIAGQGGLITAIDAALVGIRRTDLRTRAKEWLINTRLLPKYTLAMAGDQPWPLLPIDATLFDDYIWSRFFQATLSSEHRRNVLATSYYAVEKGWTSAHATSRRGHNASTIETNDWDFFLAQTPTPFAVSRRTSVIVRYHDAIPILLPHTTAMGRVDLRNHHKALKANVQAKAFFACTSPTVMADLLRLHPEAADNAAVIPDMISPAYFVEPVLPQSVADIIRLRACAETEHTSTGGAKSARSPEMRDRKYVLAVSTLEPRKNYKLLFDAWNLLTQHVEDRPLLVIVANIGWRVDDEIRELRNLVKDARVAHLARVAPHELRALYNGAQAVICPSRSEGFDLSGVEAMMCGAPLIASDIAVHRWVYGDCAVYFDPYDIDACAAAMRNVLTAPRHTGRLAELRAAGLKQASQFTCDALAPKWANLLDDLARRASLASTIAYAPPRHVQAFAEPSVRDWASAAMPAQSAVERL